MRAVSLQKLPRVIHAAGFGALAAALLAFAPNPAVHAAVTPASPTAQVSFTFDDGYKSFITNSAPILAAHGLKGTGYIIPTCVGMTTAPNTCEANDESVYMTWNQVTQLQDQYGWEIGSHSLTHPLMSEITPAQLETEVHDSKTALEAHGFHPTSFATPFGDYSPAVQAAIAKYYTSHRPFQDLGFNTYPYNPYLLRVQEVQGGVSVATVKGWIDQAKADNTWLILVFHDVKPNGSTDPDDYEYKNADLDQIAAYVQAQGIAAPTITEGLAHGTENQLPPTTLNPENGWTTDTPNNVSNDTGSNGDTPNPEDSIKMTASTTGDTHIFASQVNVDPDQEYYISGYANITAMQSGEVALYIDEYDVNGNWVSGKYAQALTSPEMKDIAYIYKATSANVAKAAAQIIVTQGSGITAYIDNVQWFPVAAGSTPDPDPEPTTTDIMTNGQFNDGIADGWTTDNTAVITADNGNHGSSTGAQNAIHFTAPTTGNAHLFAPQVNVTSGTHYTVKAFLNVTTLTSGEVAFYIDEYDANGNWVSGQYIFAQRNVATGEITFDYTPTNATVAKASLQFIVEGNSGISGYLDDVRWLTPETSTPTDPTEPTDPTPPAPTTLQETSFQNGIADGWTTDDSTAITADANGNGAADETQHAVKLTSNATRNIELFGPQVAVTNGTSYTLQAYLNILSLVSGGEVAFYVDEYDASGNWVSGQYLQGIATTGTHDVSLGYTPTGAAVASSSLQVIVTAGVGTNAYLDSVKWMTA